MYKAMLLAENSEHWNLLTWIAVEASSLKGFQEEVDRLLKDCEMHETDTEARLKAGQISHDHNLV